MSLVLFGLVVSLLYCAADILRQFENMVEVILPRLPSSLDLVPDPSGKAALIWILGEYGEVSFSC